MARVRVLGCPALLDGAGERVYGLRETALELLVHLAVHRDGASAEKIMAEIYGRADPRRAAERFSTDLANLRSRLRHAAGVGRAVQPVVRARGGYRLDPELVGVDWWQVQDACRRAKSADVDDQTRIGALREAAVCFSGLLADGAAYDWLPTVQEHSRQLGVAVFRRLADLVSGTDPQEGVACLDRACHLDPCNEDLASRAIRTHLTCGDTAAAQARLEQLREALADLGERPQQATIALLPQLRP